MKQILSWFQNLDRKRMFLICGLSIGIYLIVSSLLKSEIKESDLSTINGTIKRIYEIKEGNLFGKNYFPDTYVYLDLNEYKTAFILGKRGNSFSAEKFEYGELNDRNIFLHIKKADINKMNNEGIYEPYSAWTKSLTLLPLDKTLAERNSDTSESWKFGIILIVIASFIYFFMTAFSKE